MSKQSGHSIDDLFKRGLENHEVVPSFKTWDNIQYHLPVAVPFYKKPFFVYGMLVSFAMLCSLSYYMFNKQIATKHQTQTVEQRLTNVAKMQDAESSANNLLANTDNITAKMSEKSTILAENQAIMLNEKTQNNYTEQTIANDILDKQPQKNIDKEKGFFTKNKTFGNTTTFQKNRRNNTKHNKNISVSAVVNPDIFGVSNHNNSYDWAKENDIFQAKNSSESINASFGTNTKHIFPPHASQNVNYFSSEIAKVALSNASQINKLPLLEALQIANEMIWEAETSETSATIEKPIDFPIDPNIASITGLYFTTFAGINNTWILNSEAVDATVNSGKLNYLLDFGSTYGFATGYDFSPHWGLQIEWIVSSKQGQRYTHLEHGATTASTTDVNLVYTYLPVLAKFRMSKISKLTKQPIVLNYVGGVQYGVLKSAEIPVNNPIIHDDLYKKNSWGFVLGADYNMALSKHYAVSLGGRASISTTSKNANEFIFPNRKTSNNILLGARASLHYRFKR